MAKNIAKRVQEKETKRSQLLSELFAIKKMLDGSFCEIYVKCGKKNCRCQKGELHPHKRISWRKQGRSINRAVPKEHHPWVEEMTGQCQKFRELKRDLKILENDIHDLINEHEEEIVAQTKKGKSYLDV